MQIASLQTTSNVLMVRPSNFGFNHETAANNSFQVNLNGLSPEVISAEAVKAFDRLVAKMRAVHINVEVIQEPKTPVNPDAVFPNNWISFHEPDFIITYPMYAPQRRTERREETIKLLRQGYHISKRYKFEEFEADERYLEGTGSMIFDRVHKIAYACKSIRTDEQLFYKFCSEMNFKPLLFNSVTSKGMPVYHTNVMMSLGEDFVIICMESIQNASERRVLKQAFKQTNKELIDISLKQVELFAGNMMQVRNDYDEKYLIMSTSAYNSLSSHQLNRILPKTKIINSDLDIIETYGGGSARCMIAELFIEKK